MAKIPEKISPKILSESTAAKNLDKKNGKDRIAIYVKKSTIEYELELRKLQVELLKLQNHVKDKGLRIAMLFEGRDAAGKGGTIKRIIEHLNPRGARVVALEKPSDRETTQWYFQRYSGHLPAEGEMVFFDRSWYNRAMVEPVMGFCSDEQNKRFLKYAPLFERMIIKEGIKQFKFYFSVSKDIQKKRFEDREDDLLKQYKLSPVDALAQELWNNYSIRKFQMLTETNSTIAPWTIVRSDHKKTARIACIRYILKNLEYKGKISKKELIPDPKIIISGIDEIRLMEDNLLKPGSMPG
ncbi:MAG: polyphosphate kinase 2 [Candidatus Neomarinimicrobiota bacterium]